MTAIYAAHFGLDADPFSLSPDPDFLYESPAHSEALAGLRLALASRRGLATLIGEVGTGKTTLLYALLRDLEPAVRTAYLANTKLSFDELLRQALADFGVPAPAPDRLALLEAFQGFLRQSDTEGAIAALIIDEAQNLDADTFEHLRLLTNFETYSTKLLQIVLVGQPELAVALGRDELRQVNERIAHRCRLEPLSRYESRRYVAHRLERAGGSLALFTRPGLAVILTAAGGVPRRLNILCHTALLFAFGRGAAAASAADAWAAVRERYGRVRHLVAARPVRRTVLVAAGALLAIGGTTWVGLGRGGIPPAPRGAAASAPGPPPFSLAELHAKPARPLAPAAPEVASADALPPAPSDKGVAARRYAPAKLAAATAIKPSRVARRVPRRRSAPVAQPTARRS
ncbi:MAG: ExeA family protein, partial [Candidatus Binatia bacterium]